MIEKEKQERIFTYSQVEAITLIAFYCGAHEAEDYTKHIDEAFAKEVLNIYDQWLNSKSNLHIVDIVLSKVKNGKINLYD